MSCTTGAFPNKSDMSLRTLPRQAYMRTIARQHNVDVSNADVTYIDRHGSWADMTSVILPVLLMTSYDVVMRRPVCCRVSGHTINVTAGDDSGCDQPHYGTDRRHAFDADRLVLLSILSLTSQSRQVSGQLTDQIIRSPVRSLVRSPVTSGHTAGHRSGHFQKSVAELRYHFSVQAAVSGSGPVRSAPVRSGQSGQIQSDQVQSGQLQSGHMQSGQLQSGRL